MFGMSKQLTKKLTIYVSALASCGSALAWCIAHAESIKNAVSMFQSADAEVRIDADSKSFDVWNTQDLVIKIYPLHNTSCPLGRSPSHRPRAA